MCSLSFVRTENDFILTMNRDESRERPNAELPQAFRGNAYITPIDPLGEGTWIALESSGWAFSLMNFYPSGYSNWKEQKTSRGKIILKLLEDLSPPYSCKQIEQVIHPKAYHPFELSLFHKDHDVLDLISNGSHFEVKSHQTNAICLVSSSWKPEIVTKHRKALFEQIDKSTANAEGLFDLHRSLDDEIGTRSFLMRREESLTHSISQISSHSFRYWDTRQNSEPSFNEAYVSKI